MNVPILIQQNVPNFFCKNCNRPYIVSNSKRNPPFKCKKIGCKCKKYFHHVTSGSWSVRCRCKHKNIDHNCSNPPYTCQKPKCTCQAFVSPFVCNCGHNWADHETKTIQTSTISLQDRFDINRDGELPRGLKEDDVII
ncbi:MAG: hypothetical protein EZS28_010937 [Streblomastix strix]|uniref:Uncharacterized protein n=1 Tax=Streblomastix strix TaxID=222440 RepID=A0A5J4WG84_9EUKA|nr:MAG: hypothetical protein EZS28_010937 [Streblomastix strix]